jgi:hypothetical protein
MVHSDQNLVKTIEQELDMLYKAVESGTTPPKEMWTSSTEFEKSNGLQKNYGSGYQSSKFKKEVSKEEPIESHVASNKVLQILQDADAALERE